MPRLNKLFLVLLAAVASSPLNAFAESPGFDLPPERVVRFGDLDLNKKSGVVTLYSRIRSAAREVCEPMEEVSIKLLRAKLDCRYNAVARAAPSRYSLALRIPSPMAAPTASVRDRTSSFSRIEDT